MSDWASRLVTELIANQKVAQTDQQLLIGQIASTSPVSIKMYDQIVNKYVYIDPRYTALSSAQVDAAFALEHEIPAAIVDVIKTSLKQQLIKTGDTVIVLRDGVSFYILTKVVVA